MSQTQPHAQQQTCSMRSDLIEHRCDQPVHTDPQHHCPCGTYWTAEGERTVPPERPS